MERRGINNAIQLRARLLVQVRESAAKHIALYNSRVRKAGAALKKKQLNTHTCDGTYIFLLREPVNGACAQVSRRVAAHVQMRLQRAVKCA